MKNVKSKMMRNVKLGLIALLIAIGQSGVNAQTTVFREIFSGSTKDGQIITKAQPRVTYTTNLPTNQGSRSGSIEVVSGRLSFSPGKPENKEEAQGNVGYVIGETTKFGSPYQSILNKNQGTVTWYTSMVYNRTARLASTFGAGYQGMVTILACDKPDPTDPNAQGYGLFLMGEGKTNRLLLVYFTNGIDGWKVSDNNNTIIELGPRIPLAPRNVIIAKVTYQPETNTWQLATTDVEDTFKDPLKVNYTTQSDGRSHDGSTKVELPYFGFASCFSKSSGFSRFDNFYVTVD